MPFDLHLRSLARARGLVAAVVLTLALGLGALTLTYAVVDATAIRQPPFAQAERLTMLYVVRQPPASAPYRERWSYPRTRMLARSTTSFSALANYSPTRLNISGGGDAESVAGEVVAPSYFALLGARALHGRVFAPDEDDAQNPSAVVMLGFDLWQRRYAADPAIVGKALRLNGVPLTVVGVMPSGFRGLSDQAQLWIPTVMAPRLTYPEYLVSDQSFVSVVARLRDGVTLSSANAELDPLGATIDRALPVDDPVPGERIGAVAVPLNEARVDPRVKRSLFVLLAAVVVLHLLACANVTSLLLGRAASRRREAAVRIALGSSRGRLFGHFAAEGLVMTLAAGTLGMLLAWWACAVVTIPVNAWGPRRFYGSVAAFDTPAFGVRPLLFGVVLTLVTALIVALSAPLALMRVNVGEGLKDGARGTSSGGLALRRPSARAMIVALEAAFAVVLVVSAGLLVDSFRRMRSTSIGVESANVLTFDIRPSEARVPTSHAPQYISRLIAAIERVPGVVSVTVDGGAPLSGTARSTLYVMGRPQPRPEDAPPILRHYVAPAHFTTLGIPLLRGRAFTVSDVAGSPRVTIISETAARTFWPNEDPIGKRVWFGGGSSFDRPDSSAEIVGIVADVMYEPLDRRPNRASFYTPYTQFSYGFRTYFVRTEGDPIRLVSPIRRAVAAVEPEMPMMDVRPLDALMGESWARHRFDALLFGGFGVAALVLAAAGIFAVVAYAVGERTREMGIRIALGAPAGAVMRLIVGEGMMFPTIGLLFGIAGALAATRLLRASLYEVTPTEPRVFVATILVLLIVCLAACLIPARRAARVSPLEAMKV